MLSTTTLSKPEQALVIIDKGEIKNNNGMEFFRQKKIEIEEKDDGRRKDEKEGLFGHKRTTAEDTIPVPTPAWCLG